MIWAWFHLHLLKTWQREYFFYIYSNENHLKIQCQYIIAIKSLVAEFKPIFILVVTKLDEKENQKSTVYMMAKCH